ncbi:hypothetical protein SO802_025436 [Lithocarpus litseifolius]|uniref:Uncharacterized protein n=1 Tax=Lithocarpus litseifolius TaxID=425828 RepID=A0AAW2BWT3_9ROSI
MFDHLLHITRTYYIHNAIVKPIKPEHRIVDNVYQWTINPTTLIEEISNDDSSLPAPSFSFVPFAEFHKHMDYSRLVDVIAIAIDECPARQLQTRNGSSMIQEVILIDQL